MEDNLRTSSRRNFVKGVITAGAVTTSLSSPVLAKGRTAHQETAESSGIKSEVQQLLDEGKFDEAEKLSQNCNIEYRHNKLNHDPASLNTSAISEDEISQVTNGVFDKNKSEIESFMYNMMGNLYNIQIEFDHTPQDALVKDIVGESENSSNNLFQGVSPGFA